MSDLAKEEARKHRELVRLGQWHDCVLAGCAVNPVGETIPPGKPQKRPEKLPAPTELWMEPSWGDIGE